MNDVFWARRVNKKQSPCLATGAPRRVPRAEERLSHRPGVTEGKERLFEVWGLGEKRRDGFACKVGKPANMLSHQLKYMADIWGF